MFGSTVLEVGIGVVFGFLMVSLMTSVATEAIASFFNLRATTLLNGIKSMLNDPDFNRLAVQIYNHALANPLQVLQPDQRQQQPARPAAPGEVSALAQPTTLPSYIEPQKFASALIDTLASFAPASVGLSAKVSDAIDATTDPQLKATLRHLFDMAQGDVERFRSGVAGWFDASMGRVSGIYKRHAQAVSLWVALGLAIVLNVDTIAIARTLWHQPTLASGITVQVTDTAKSLVDRLDTTVPLPIGWSLPTLDDKHASLCAYLAAGWHTVVAAPGASLLSLLAQIIGWTITALATLFGAPFWFDTLRRFVSLRGSGPATAAKPQN